MFIYTIKRVIFIKNVLEKINIHRWCIFLNKTKDCVDIWILTQSFVF